MFRALLFLSSLVLSAGCSGPSSPPSSPTGVPSAPPLSTAQEPSDAATQADAAPPDSASAAAELPPVAPPKPPPVFPPPTVAPPHARTAQEGDGAWTPLAGGQAEEGGPLLLKTTIHPHPVKRFTYMAVVAIDLDRVALRLIAGTQEPESKTVVAADRPGLIPKEDISRLLAVFNGGFQARHGHYGMALQGKDFLPPVQDACTIVIGRDESIRIGTFSKLRLDSGVAAYRQTPPCLVENGMVNEAVKGEWTSRRWGHAIEGKTEIRRTALGIDATGRILYFGLGEEMTPQTIAEGMKAVGALHAAELDINWSYTRFLLYGTAQEGGIPTVVSTLIPKLKYTPGGYVEKSASRDFFYLRRK